MSDEKGKKAACSRHPFLGPDAWFMIEAGRPRGDGIRASVVCRFACPIRDACPVQAADGVIARGGWYTNGGVFVDAPEGHVDLNQAAAYIGLEPNTVRLILRKMNISYLFLRNRSYVSVEAMQLLARRHGPAHGTIKMYELHLLRGETPCKHCTLVATDGSKELVTSKR